MPEDELSPAGRGWSPRIRAIPALGLFNAAGRLPPGTGRRGGRARLGLGEKQILKPWFNAGPRSPDPDMLEQTLHRACTGRGRPPGGPAGRRGGPRRRPARADEGDELAVNRATT